jgi:SAM-dependent methyltransferase
MRQRLQPWLLACAACGLWRSRLTDVDQLQPSEAVDEERRQTGLAPLRRRSYQRTLQLIAGWRPLAGLRLLDVGCAYGWFLATAREAGMDACGVEPDETIAGAAAAQGGRVWVGYFPRAVPPDESFDVVVFNDVLEHLVDLEAALLGVQRLLRPRGLLVVSAPDSQGILFRAAVLSAHLGRHGLLDRLWQKGFPSPHVSYFDLRSLAALVARRGFSLRASVPLHSLAFAGLWSRLHMDRRPSPGSIASYMALAVFTPFSRFLPSDQRLTVFAREG